MCKHQMGDHEILDEPHACMSCALLPDDDNYLTHQGVKQDHTWIPNRQSANKIFSHVKKLFKSFQMHFKIQKLQK